MAKLDHAPKNFLGVTDVSPTLTPIAPTNTPYKPSRGLLQGMQYTKAKDTDVTKTWQRFGWVPRDQLIQD